MKQVVIVDAIRTPIGNLNGMLSTLPAQNLGSRVIKALLGRNNLQGNQISEVIMGQVLTGACGQNPARQASINAGIPVEVPAWTINKVCGSGLKSIISGAQSIMTGDNEIVIAGGQESMSQAAHAVYIRQGVRLGDTQLIDMMMKDGLVDAFHSYSMGVTAENLVKKYEISRQEQDEFACKSQNKADLAQKSGKFKDEILPISILSKKGEIIAEQDEFIRPGTTIELLSKLKPAFDNQGTVTAGNASGVNDGAAAVLLMSMDMAEKLGKKPIAKIVSYGKAGVAPEIMGVAPVEAINQAITKAGWELKDLDLVEANEAFAAQSIAVNKLLRWDLSKINVNGGAIALGHPIGASGARILVTLLHEMQRRNAKNGLASLCIGGGLGLALCVSRV